MTGLDQTATTCQGTETPDPFAVPEARASHATPCMTTTPEATRNPEGSIAQRRPSHWSVYPVLVDFRFPETARCGATPFPQSAKADGPLERF